MVRGMIACPAVSALPRLSAAVLLCALASAGCARRAPAASTTAPRAAAS